jgi:hypothetical protein
MRTPPANLVKRLLAGRGGLNPEPVMAQRHRDHVNDARLIVHDQHAYEFRLMLHAANYPERT